MVIHNEVYSLDLLFSDSGQKPILRISAFISTIMDCVSNHCGCTGRPTTIGHHRSTCHLAVWDTAHAETEMASVINIVNGCVLNRY